jgi:hypothetical protein
MDELKNREDRRSMKESATQSIRASSDAIIANNEQEKSLPSQTISGDSQHRNNIRIDEVCFV